MSYRIGGNHEEKKVLSSEGLIILAGAAGAGGWYYYKENYGDSAAASGEVAYVTKISTLLGEDSGVLNRFAGVVEPQGDGKGKY